MNSAQRRAGILETLRGQKQPINASILAEQFHVSRQVIVNDIALLRASSVQIAATPRGYILQENERADGLEFIVACRHSRERVAEELYLVVDNGAGLLDVIVEHPVYGQISGQLHIFSRYDADNFLQKLEGSHAAPLSRLTDGAHLHTLSCHSREEYLRVAEALRKAGILLEQNA